MRDRFSLGQAATLSSLTSTCARKGMHPPQLVPWIVWSCHCHAIVCRVASFRPSPSRTRVPHAPDVAHRSTMSAALAFVSHFFFWRPIVSIKPCCRLNAPRSLQHLAGTARCGERLLPGSGASQVSCRALVDENRRKRRGNSARTGRSQPAGTGRTRLDEAAYSVLACNHADYFCRTSRHQARHAVQKRISCPGLVKVLERPRS